MAFSEFMYFNSQMLRSLAFDAATGELVITFRSGASYVYSGVPEHAYRSLAAAKSVGTYFHAVFRPAFVGRPLTAIEVDALVRGRGRFQAPLLPTVKEPVSLPEFVFSNPRI